MNNSEFDNYAKNYHKQMGHKFRRLVDPSDNYFIELKAKLLYKFIEEYFVDKEVKPLKILDFGCGLGDFSKYLQSKDRKIYGLDLSFEMIKYANSNNPYSNVFFHQANGDHIPIQDRSFDVVFTSCVFHHIEIENFNQIFNEIKRVCKINGIIIVFEHNPNNLITQFVVRTTPIDKNAKLLQREYLLRVMRQHQFTIYAKGYLLFGPKFVDEFLTENLPGIYQFPLGGQYFISAIN
jgi:ubiquinone/menaquinone biosynthesis C-methylase UbiE